jgi:hypothetical protein
MSTYNSAQTPNVDQLASTTALPDGWTSMFSFSYRRKGPQLKQRAAFIELLVQIVRMLEEEVGSSNAI